MLHGLTGGECVSLSLNKNMLKGVVLCVHVGPLFGLVDSMGEKKPTYSTSVTALLAKLKKSPWHHCIYFLSMAAGRLMEP